MKRNLSILCAMLLTLWGVSLSYGTNTEPTAKIVEPDDDVYIEPGDSVSFDGEGSGAATPPTGSYDGDNGDPKGGGNGISEFKSIVIHRLCR